MATSTGRGDWPFISTWEAQPWNVQTAAANGPNKAIWVDWFFNAVAGGVFTLTATPGSFALTGTTATLKVGRQLIATGGVYGLSGTTATLKVGRKLSATGGTYVLTGTDAILTHGSPLGGASTTIFRLLMGVG